MGQLILTAPIERGSVWGLSFNHDSSQLAVANHDGSAIVLDTLSGQEILSVSDEIPQILVRAIFSPDGKYLLTAGTSGIVQVWDLESGQLASSTAAHSTIGDLDFGPDGQTIVTVSGDAEAKLWRFSVSGLQEITTLAGHTARMRAAEFNPDGSQLVTSSADGTIRYWDVSPFGNEELPPFIGHESRVTDVDISADGSRLVSASNDGTAIVWDLSSGTRLITFSEQTGRVNSADFSPSGDLLATGSEDTSVFIWHAESGELLTKLEGHVEGNVGNFFQGVIDVQFSPDGERVASAAADGWVKVWDVNSGAELFGIQGHPEGYGVMRVAFSPDGSLLAAGTDDLFDDAMVKVWDARTGQELYTVDENRIRIWGVTFSQDGKRLAISDRSGIVNMWELPPHDNESAANPPQAKELFSVPAHSSSTFGLLFTPDGKQIVSTASDGKLSFLDSWTGKSLLTIDRPYGLGETAFGPGAKWLAAAGTDGQVYFFVLDLDTLLSLAHSRVTRSLTTAECQQFLHMAECPES
jgi:WD40 repeat protein